MKKFLCAAGMAIALTASATELQPGDTAPDFKAADQDGNAWALKDHLGGKPIVIYFYPAAMTGGCTKQACGYRDYLRQNDQPDLLVVGISGDSPQNLKYFQQAEELNFTLLSDGDGSIARAYGVPVKEGEKSITRTVDGEEVELTRSSTASRWTFIVSPDGKILHIDNKVAAANDLDNVLAVLKKQESKASE